MPEQTRFSLVREFVETARMAGDDNARYASQDFLMEKLIGPRKTLEAAQTAMLGVMSDIAQIFDGASYQIGQGYDTLIRRIPENEDNVRHTVRKVALKLKMIDAPGWGGPQ